MEGSGVKLVEVYGSPNPSGGLVVETLLKNKGIEVHSEYNIPGYNLGVSLLVPETDKEKAQVLLRQAGFIPAEEEGVLNSQKKLSRKLGTILLIVLVLLGILAIYSNFYAQGNA